jgi:hypothetical protein
MPARTSVPHVASIAGIRLMPPSQEEKGFPVGGRDGDQKDRPAAAPTISQHGISSNFPRRPPAEWCRDAAIASLS